MKSTIRNTQYAILITLILAWLVLPQTAQAATYYMNTSATGADNGGVGNDAWQSFTSMSAALHALGDYGAGDTVIVSPGNYGVWDNGILDDNRDDYLSFEAATAVDPNISQLILKSSDWNSPAYTPYLKFTGFTFDPGYSDTDADTIYLYSAQYVQFYDCHFEALKNVNPSFGDYYPYMDATISAAGRHTFSPWSIGITKYITISNCTFYNSANSAITAQGSNWLIENCSFDRSSADFIKLAGRNDLDPNLYGDNIIQDCTFTDANKAYGGYSWPGTPSPNEAAWTTIPEGEGRLATFYSATGVVQGSGIFRRFHTNYMGRCMQLFADDNTSLPSPSTQGVWRLDSDPYNVYFTTSANGDAAHEDGIELLYSGYDRPSIVQRCWFENNVGQCMKPDGGHHIIRNNVFIGNKNVWPLLFGEEYPNAVFEVYENIIVSKAGVTCGVRAGAGVEIRLHNNIIGGALTSTSPTIDADNNIWLSTKDQLPDMWEGSHDQYGVSTASLFANYAIWDFKTIAGSPAIDAGDVSYTDTTDYTGIANVRVDNAPPDIGAYEYISSTPPPSILCGDVSGDGKITAYDAGLAARIAVGLNHPDIKSPAAAEVSGDGKVTAYDAALIAQRAVGLIEKFPVEEW